jgi:hypothetical protein
VHTKIYHVIYACTIGRIGPRAEILHRKLDLKSSSETQFNLDNRNSKKLMVGITENTLG